MLIFFREVQIYLLKFSEQICEELVLMQIKSIKFLFCDEYTSFIRKSFCFPIKVE